MNKADVARSWLLAFEEHLKSRNWQGLENLFLPDAGWRDLVAFTWTITQAPSLSEQIELMSSVIDDIAPHNFTIDPTKPAPDESAQDDPFEIWFQFETRAGKADGYCYLVPSDEAEFGFAAEKLLTRLVSLHENPPQWPVWSRFDKEYPDQRWSDVRAADTAYEDRDPEVLIVGGGQFGVMTAAYLERLGVDALIIDKQPRVGDAWRSRYEALLLHQPHGILYFPFMRFPESFPEYIPKDKIADWFEAYVNILDLNFWTSTEFQGGTYDEATGEWTVSIRKADGSVRTMRPKHVVLATGGSGIPTIPQVPGIEAFKGEVTHARHYRTSDGYAGKNVLIIGCGTTAHDLALDIAKAGGKPAMLQRSPLIVIDLPTANTLYGDYNARKVPTELVDVRFMAGGVFPQLFKGFVEFTKWSDQADAELHEKLRAAGMKIWSGPDSAGFYHSYLLTQGNYYINVGASEAIIDGRIKIIQTEDMEGFYDGGVTMKDGSQKPFDAVIYATAHEPISTLVEKLFGPEMNDRLGPIWGYGPDGEMRNIAKPTAQPGLWIMMGSIPMARWYSPLVALMIRAQMLGIVPEQFLDGKPRSLRAERPALAAAE